MSRISKSLDEFFGFSEFVSDMVGSALDPVGGLADNLNDNVKDLLKEVQKNIDALTTNISRAYQNNLGFTMDSLDYFTNKQTKGIMDAMQEINDLLQENVADINNKAKSILGSAQKVISTAVNEVEEKANKVILNLGEAGDFLIDKAIYNLLNLISWILLGVGLIVLAVVLLRTGLPQGTTGIIVMVLIGLFILSFGAIALLPRFRTYVIRYTGLGLKQRLDPATKQPSIFAIFPEVIKTGKTTELEITGYYLTPNNTPPDTAIGGISTPIVAFENKKLILDVRNLELDASSTNLVLSYPDNNSVNAVVRIQKYTPPPPPKFPNLIIEDFTLSPSSPEVNKTVIAKITIKNSGEKESGKFTVIWKPFDSHPGNTVEVNRLPPSGSTIVSMDDTYPEEGNYTTIVRVDAFYQIEESEEGDNLITRPVTVIKEPLPPSLPEWDFQSIVHTDDVAIMAFINEKKFPPTAFQGAYKNIASSNWVDFWHLRSFEPSTQNYQLVYVPSLQQDFGRGIAELMETKTIVVLGHTHNAQHFYYLVGDDLPNEYREKWDFYSIPHSDQAITTFLNERRIPPSAIHTVYKNRGASNWISFWIKQNYEQEAYQYQIEYVANYEGAGNSIADLMRNKQIIILGYTSNSKHLYYLTVSGPQ